MPTISFSQDFIQSSETTNNSVGRMINYGTIRVPCLLSWAGSTRFNTEYQGYISIMKGTVPSTLTFTDFNQRSSDSLCSFTTSNFSPSSSTYYLNPAVIGTIYVAAGASGTATWFWWYIRTGYDGVGTGIVQQLAGTVGVTGSGADLEVPSTTITSGQLLRITNLRLRLPTTYTY